MSGGGRGLRSHLPGQGRRPERSDHRTRLSSEQRAEAVAGGKRANQHCGEVGSSADDSFADTFLLPLSEAAPGTGPPQAGFRLWGEGTGPPQAGFRLSGEGRGLTLVELIVTVAILSILASAAIPIARFQVKRQNERMLRYDLWQMRDAIDKYKDAADKGAFQTKVDSQNYPPDLETLVNGVDVQGKKLKFLRRIPVDPMTGKAEWGLRSMQDDPDSTSYGGQSVFDVYSKSQGTALDGTKYATW